MSFLSMMRDRGLVAQVTFEDELAEHLKEKRTAYAGFDPTADSLTAGHLMAITGLMRWQQAGNRVIVVVGGGTGLVGDPSFKTEMRNLLTEDIVNQNLAALKTQLGRFIDLKDAKQGIMVNNADWLKPLNYMSMLRDVGRHFSVNRMLTADCFKQRMEKGLSFLEFNYMIMQSYDFLHLYRTEKCTVQMGGDDQWSNILSGADLIRRLESAKAFALTLPLLTTSDGKKMGKTEQGAVWLDASRTPPFEFYQYWRNIEDVKVGQTLGYFTFLPMTEVRRLAALQGAEINEAKKVLAYELTKLVHGQAVAEDAQKTALMRFAAGAGAQAGGGNEPVVTVDRARFGTQMSALDLVVEAGIFPSKGEAKRMIEQGGLTINDQKVESFTHMVDLKAMEGAGALIRKGKKHYYRCRFSG